MADTNPGSIAATLGICERRLRARYGQPRHGNKSDPLNELFYILLSRQTTPTNLQNAYCALRRRFPRRAQLGRASLSSIQASINGAGLGPTRAREIRDIARRTRQDFGRTTLAPLRRMSTGEAEQYLLSLPGVGKKTARCVLMYSLGRPSFPVDVHCFRVLNRLGLVSLSPPVRNHEEHLQAMVPEKLRYSLHVTLVALGRDLCRPRDPDCLRCRLVPHCQWGRSRTDALRGQKH